MQTIDIDHPSQTRWNSLRSSRNWDPSDATGLARHCPKIDLLPQTKVCFRASSSLLVILRLDQVVFSRADVLLVIFEWLRQAMLLLDSKSGKSDGLQELDAANDVGSDDSLLRRSGFLA